MLSLFFFIDRLCRLLSIFRPGQDAKLIVFFFFKIKKRENLQIHPPGLEKRTLRSRPCVTFLTPGYVF